MMSEQEVCTARVLNQLWRNQIAICEALHARASWLSEAGHPERSVSVSQLAGKLLDSSRIIEPALGSACGDKYQQVRARKRRGCRATIPKSGQP